MSWPVVKLGEVCEINIGRTPSRNEPRYWDEGIHSWASISDLSKQRKLFDTKEQFSECARHECNMRSAVAGTVLFSFKLSIGKVAIAAKDIFTNEAIAALPVKDERKLDPEFLARVLEYIDFSDSGSRAVMGRTLNKKSLSNIKIPLPPLPEQKRIAGILDQADALRRLRTRALEKLNTLGQAIFQEMFGDPGTNPKKWKVGKIGDLLSEASYGTSSKANTEGRGIPILRMGNVTYDGRLDLSDLKHIEIKAHEIDKYTTRRGDILFNRTNSKELVGKTAVVKRDEPMAIAGYLVRARVNAAGNADYISTYLNSRHGKATLMGMCKNIVGMANINAKEMQRIEIALPPRDLQDQFSARLDGLASQRSTIETSVASLSSLFTSLQHRAFRGEL